MDLIGYPSFLDWVVWWLSKACNCLLLIYSSKYLYLERISHSIISQIVGYSLTSFIAGFASARLYRQMNGQHWVRNTLICIFIYTLPVFLIWVCIHTIALFYDSTIALPFSWSVVLFALW
jgi:transmembrane 9 superfamily protein 3